MLRWYLIHTKPSCEGLTRMNLERQDYEVYLPRVLQSVRCSGRWRERIVPLFPRYLFLRLSEGLQALGPVRSTAGVSNVVRFGAQYAIVPDEVVRDLQARADSTSGLHRLGHGSRLTSGAGIKIDRGPFEGLDGVFEREAGAERVIVLLKLLGRDVSVCIPDDTVLLRDLH